MTLKKIITLSLLILTNIVFSQKRFYELSDSASNLMEIGKYKEGLAVWEFTSKNFVVDPRKKSMMLNQMWANNDTVSFKQTFKELISENGAQIDDYNGWSFYTAFTSNKNLVNWYNNVYEINHPKFLKENSEILYLIQKIKDFQFIDQQICIGQINKFKRDNSVDSILDKNLNQLSERMAMAVFLDLIKICEKLKYLPNSIDQKHPDITGIINLILLHNTKIAYKVDEKWKMIMPYLEKAVNDGKYRPMDLLWHYDNSMYWNYGYQYYGTLFPHNVGHNNKIPIKDEATVNERRKKYGLPALAQ